MSPQNTSIIRSNDIASRLLFAFAFFSLVVFGGIFLYIAIRQTLYPGFAEMMEGNILNSIERVAHGLTAYPNPDGSFVPLDYMPLYYYVCAPFYLFFGDSFIGPRLVSSVAALAAGWLIGLIAWRESKSRAIAMLAAAIYFSGFRIMDAYVTIALPDSLLLLWLLLGFYFLAYGRNRFHDFLWLLFYTLAFWTKQQGAIYFGFAVVFAALFRTNTPDVRSRLPRWTLILGLLLGGPVLYLVLGPYLGEKFYYYTSLVPRHWHHTLWSAIRRTGLVLICFVPFSTLLALRHFRQSGESEWFESFRRTLVSPLGWFTVTAFISAAFTESSVESSNNHYIPFIAALSVVAALGVSQLVTNGETKIFGLWVLVIALSAGAAIMALRPFADERDVPPRLAAVAAITVLVFYVLFRLPKFAITVRSTIVGILLVCGQFGVAAFRPSNYTPEPGYQNGITRLREALSHLDAPVAFVPYGNTPAALTLTKIGRVPSWVALDDLERQDVSDGERQLAVSGFTERIRSGRPLYLLTEGRLGSDRVWGSLAQNVELVKDYGEEFAGVREISHHWYTSRSYPRYLYKVRAVPQ